MIENGFIKIKCPIHGCDMLLKNAEIQRWSCAEDVNKMSLICPERGCLMEFTTSDKIEVSCNKTESEIE